MPALGHEEVRRLDVAVNDPFGMRGRKAIRNLAADVEHLLDRQRLAGDSLLERAAIEQFQHDVRLPFVLADVVDGADIGVVERRDGARLSLKPFEHVAGADRRRRQKLDRDGPAQAEVFGAIHHAHPARAERFHDPVMRDYLTDDHGEVGVTHEVRVPGQRKSRRTAAPTPSSALASNASDRVEKRICMRSLASRKVEHFPGAVKRYNHDVPDG